MRFNDIYGLDESKKRLISGVRRNQVAHAQLLTGIEGSALLPMALAYAAYLNCTNPSETDVCGECSSCNKTLKFIHPDIHFVFPTSGTEDITAKDAVSKKFLPIWRNFLKNNPYGTLVDWSLDFGENKQLNISRQESREIIEALSLKAFEGRFKIMLIWMPELMHPTAANGILKILEEPANNTVFLLVSSQPEKLLGTIRSRCQLIQIPAFSDAELSHILTNTYGIAGEKTAQLVHLADGSLRNALTLYEETDVDLHDMFLEWMRLCFSRNFTALSTYSDKFATLTKAAQKTLFLYGLEILRESLIALHGEEKLLRVMGAERDFVIRFSKTLTTDVIDFLAQQIAESHYYLERNANAKIVFMNLSIVISQTFKR